MASSGIMLPLMVSFTNNTKQRVGQHIKTALLSLLTEAGGGVSGQ